jgi:hypothetical protein
MNEPDTLGFGGGHAILACVALVSRRYRTPDRVGQTIVANGRARICPELGLSHPLSTSLRTLVNLWLDAKERELRDRAGKQ